MLFEKKQKKGKMEQKGRGPVIGSRDPKTLPTISHSLPKVAHSLSHRGHGRRLASPSTATCRRREKGATGPLSPRQPPPKLHRPSPSTSQDRKPTQTTRLRPRTGHPHAGIWRPTPLTTSFINWEPNLSLNHPKTPPIRELRTGILKFAG